LSTFFKCHNKLNKILPSKKESKKRIVKKKLRLRSL
jgi:hypothetical protein